MEDIDDKYAGGCGMIDAEKMRERFADTNRGKTHYEGCEYAHPLCAIEALCREVGRLREGTAERSEPDWLPAPVMALGVWQSNEEGHRHAEELRRNMNAVLPSGQKSWLPAPDMMPGDLEAARICEPFDQPEYEGASTEAARNASPPICQHNEVHSNGY